MGGKQPSKAHLDKPCIFSPGVVLYYLSESTLHILFNHQNNDWFFHHLLVLWWFLLTPKVIIWQIPLH